MRFPLTRFAFFLEANRKQQRVKSDTDNTASEDPGKAATWSQILMVSVCSHRLIHHNYQIFSVIKRQHVRKISKSDCSCSVPPMFNQLGKHRPPHRLQSYCRSVYRIIFIPTKACHWPLPCEQPPRSEDLLLETTTPHPQRSIHSCKERRGKA